MRVEAKVKITILDGEEKGKIETLKLYTKLLHIIQNMELLKN